MGRRVKNANAKGTLKPGAKSTVIANGGICICPNNPDHRYMVMTKNNGPCKPDGLACDKGQHSTCGENVEGIEYSEVKCSKYQPENQANCDYKEFKKECQAYREPHGKLISSENHKSLSAKPPKVNQIDPKHLEEIGIKSETRIAQVPTGFTTLEHQGQTCANILENLVTWPFEINTSKLFIDFCPNFVMFFSEICTLAISQCAMRNIQSCAKIPTDCIFEFNLRGLFDTEEGYSEAFLLCKADQLHLDPKGKTFKGEQKNLASIYNDVIDNTRVVEKNFEKFGNCDSLLIQLKSDANQDTCRQYTKYCANSPEINLNDQCVYAINLCVMDDQEAFAMVESDCEIIYENSYLDCEELTHWLSYNFTPENSEKYLQVCDKNILNMAHNITEKCMETIKECAANELEQCTNIMNICPDKINLEQSHENQSSGPKIKKRLGDISQAFVHQPSPLDCKNMYEKITKKPEGITIKAFLNKCNMIGLFACTTEECNAALLNCPPFGECQNVIEDCRDPFEEDAFVCMSNQSTKIQDHYKHAINQTERHLKQYYNEPGEFTQLSQRYFIGGTKDFTSLISMNKVPLPKEQRAEQKPLSIQKTKPKSDDCLVIYTKQFNRPSKKLADEFMVGCKFMFERFDMNGLTIDKKSVWKVCGDAIMGCIKATTDAGCQKIDEDCVKPAAGHGDIIDSIRWNAVVGMVHE